MLPGNMTALDDGSETVWRHDLHIGVDLGSVEMKRRSNSRGPKLSNKILLATEIDAKFRRSQSSFFGGSSGFPRDTQEVEDQSSPPPLPCAQTLCFLQEKI